MKNISRVILLSTSCLIWYGADNVCASVNVYSGIPKSGTHTHYITHLTEPHLSHPRGGTSEASISLCSKRYNLSFEGLIPPRELLPQGENNKLNVFKTASVCFITDTGECSGDKFGNSENVSGGNGNPGGIPDYDTPQEQCQATGYNVTSCPAGSHGDNPCPADSSYYQKCVCDANMTETCTKPYYGVGPSCDGKYASCKRDDDKNCKEEGYGQSGACPDLQTPNKKCPYNNSYYDKCVCRSDLVTCTYPQTGLGEACGGKYASCQCPSSYKSCECGGAVGATSCTVNGQTTFSDCKKCCTPLKNETGCKYGVETADDGCGGTREICSSCQRNFNSCPYAKKASDCEASGGEFSQKCTDNCGEAWGVCCKTCACRCNSAGDCSNCKPSSSYYDERCTTAVSDGCGGYCARWGRWYGLESYTRNCVDASGKIVLTYTVYKTYQQYSTRIYCDDTLTKTYGSLPADPVLLPLSPVVYPAEAVTCDRVFDFDDVTGAGQYVVTFDYNIKYCDGKAKSVTVEYLGLDDGTCRY